MKSWGEVWNMYFKALEPWEISAWQEELIDTIRNPPTRDEIAYAVRDMSRNDKTPKYPSLKDLRMQIYQNRKARDKAHKGQQSCAQCYDGWLTFQRPRGEYKGCFVSIPCLCSRGKELLYREYHDDNIRDILVKDAERVIAQRVESARTSPKNPKIVPFADIVEKLAAAFAA